MARELESWGGVVGWGEWGGSNSGITFIFLLVKL